MEKTTPTPADVPTALPGFEDDDAREKLLLETTDTDMHPSGEAEEEEIELGNEAPRPKTRRSKVIRMFAAFAAFVCILAIAVSWFFGMGWFAEQKAQPISRHSSKDGQTSPATEDEKLKMALSMVAAQPTSGTPELYRPSALEEDDQNRASTNPKPDDTVTPPAAGDQGSPTSAKESYSLPSPKDSSNDNHPSNAPQRAGVSSAPTANDSDDARGRSLFFGLSKKPAKEDEPREAENLQAAKPELTGTVPAAQIPFGALLPVRLVGSIYTLRNTGGFVRMELTRPIEGNGYAYPAGTMVVGNVRGGESVRAFVNIIGLIDPASGELIRFSGELLGRDGSSGIEGKRRNLTSRWARVFRGMKGTAASFLGSVGAIRSGSTVVLSEPIRRGTESMSEDLSDSILKNEREDTFVEVAAGASGYVLVTGLPEKAAAATNKPTREAVKE